MTSCSLGCGQAQQFGGTDVDGAEISACGNKKLSEDGMLED